ncbi:MAG: mechanosensitive ion channel family protein [Candidatus Pelagadaptatus aseana]|uniref:mechanosensitive ion channel domain-containing protein n=1 Tax=Candidatus Pelagadaptatus aseana TaxID=3120508 RepID=UPI0039B16086
MEVTTLSILLLILIGLFIGNRITKALVDRVGTERKIPENRIEYVTKSIQILWVFLGILVAIALTGSNIKDVGVLIGSSLAFLGVALFAQWSLLSNATASIIVFFFFPYRAGNWVEIIDGENTVIGKIKEISLFHVIMIDEDGATVTYPNSLVFQKAVRITRKKPARKSSADDNQKDNKATP